MAKASKKRSRLRIKAEYYGFLLLYRLFHLLSLKTGYRIAAVMMRILPFFDRRHYRRTVQHILHAEAAEDRAGAVQLARKSYREFGKLLVEIVKMDQLYDPAKISMEFATAEDRKYLDPALNPDGPRNVIIVTAHLGNWEVAGTAFSNFVNVPMTSLMRRFENPEIGRLILGHRAGTTHTVVDKSNGIRPLLKALNNDHIATVLIDQHAAGNEGVECMFFGHPAKVHKTPALLHLKTAVPILPEITVRNGDDFSFTLVTGKLIRYTPTGDREVDIRRLTQMCISGVEKLIRRYPEQWLWAPRHWLDIDRPYAEKYRFWQAPEYLEDLIKPLANSNA